MSWDSELVLYDGDTYFDTLIAEWNSAKLSIDFETYIFEPDAVGVKIEKALIAAALRGLQVRLLVDGIGASGWWQTHGSELQTHGVQVRVYHPLFITELWRRLMVDLHFIAPDRRPKRSLFMRRLNRRNHRKVSIVDGKAAFVGSVNVSRVHSQREYGEIRWRDTSARVTGRSVSDLRHAFDHAWVRSHVANKTSALPKRKIRFLFAGRARIKDSPVGLNFTRKLRRYHRMKFVSNIENAKHRIWIENAYLAPPSNIVTRLVRAAKRGVDVRILVPARSDVWFMPIIARAYYRGLIRGGVRVFEYRGRFLHAKSLIIDDSITIGTSNLNRRSFLHDLEVDVTLSKPQSLSSMLHQFEIDLADSDEIVTRGTILGSRLGRLLNYLFRYWV